MTSLGEFQYLGLHLVASGGNNTTQLIYFLAHQGQIILEYSSIDTVTGWLELVGLDFS